ncbi:MAG: metallophosphoesterase family protein [Candidatus Ranarchaeia archaeon]
MKKDLTKIFFAADVHGSNLTFRKFISAGKFYKVDVAILGGDLTGKMIVPIIDQQDGTYKAIFLGRTIINKSKQQLEHTIETISNSGFYPFIGTLDEIEEINADKEKKDELFLRLQIERMEEWIKLAEKHLKNSDIKYFMSPGNDDPVIIDEILDKTGSEILINPDEKVVYIDDIHEMITYGWSNPTPWKTPREASEEKLAIEIDKLASKVKDIENCIFNIHVPPFDSGLDTAPLLDENLVPKPDVGGNPKMVPVGSTAVRNAIEKYQPLLGLHGHIHESKGALYMGRTLIVNPGSEYGEGVLRGIVITLQNKKVKNYYFTSG